MTKIFIDESKKLGKIKAMHGVGQPPLLGVSTEKFSCLTEANIPYSRLHDVGGWFGKNMFAEIGKMSQIPLKQNGVLYLKK